MDSKISVRFPCKTKKLSPLFKACQDGDAKKVKTILLTKEAQANTYDPKIGTALYVAASNQKWQVVNAILAHSCPKDPSFQKHYQLCIYITKDNLEAAKSLLDEIEDVDFKNLQEITPLRFAVLYNKLEFVKLLVDRGANVNSREISGLMILQDFSKNYNDDHPEKRIFEYLLQRGTRLDYSSLMQIFATGSYEFAQYFLGYIKQCETLESSLHDALTTWYSKMSETLLLECDVDAGQKFAELDSDWGFGQSFMHEVCGRWNADAVKLFLPYCADLNAVDSEDSNILQYAAREQKISGPLEVLLKLKTFDVNYRDCFNCTALSYQGFDFEEAIECENAALLLKHGARIDLLDMLGRPPMLLTDQCGDGCPVVEHFEKLKLLNYEIEAGLLEKLLRRTTKKMYCEHSTINPQHIQELSKLKNVVICCQPHTTFFDLMFVKKTELIKYAENQIIADMFQEANEDFEEKYPYFGFVLNRVCEQLKNTKIALIPARKKFYEVTGRNLPIGIVNDIFCNFDYEELGEFCEIDVTKFVGF